jgi:hypothetical protein
VRISCIVEGHGEVQAVPILLRRLRDLLAPEVQLEVGVPIRVPRSNLAKQEDLKRYVTLAASQAGEDGGVLVLLDADDDLPCELGPRLLKYAKEARSDRRIRVVAAMREFEAWFLAAAESLRGRRDLPADLTAPADPEAIRDAKGWLTRHMVGRSYRETIDQPALTAMFDIPSARRSKSFDKLCRDVESLLLGR